MKPNWNEATTNFNSFLGQIKSANDKNKEKTKEIFYSLNQEEKDTMWHASMGERSKNVGYGILNHLFKDDPLFLNDEVTFFNQYVKAFTREPRFSNCAKLFIKESSDIWLTTDQIIAPFILDSFITSTDPKFQFGKIKVAFMTKLASLEPSDYALFLDLFIKKTDFIKQQAFINFLFNYADSQKIEDISKKYLYDLPINTKNQLGLTLLARGDIEIIEQYPSLVINGVNSNIMEKQFGIEVGRKINKDSFSFLISSFDNFPVKERTIFMDGILYQALLPNSSSILIDTILKSKKEHPEYFSPHTTIFLIWRTLHTYKKMDKELYLSKIFQHAKDIGELKEIRNIMSNPDNEVTFYTSTMNMKNLSIHTYFKALLYQELQEDLDEKPPTQRLKI